MGVFGFLLKAPLLDSVISIGLCGGFGGFGCRANTSPS